jgi:hypothetical protein
VCAWRERLMGFPSNLAEHNKYLILFVERITLSPRAHMQFHNHDRQLVSLYSIQNVMRLQKAPSRGSSKNAEKNHAARESA